MKKRRFKHLSWTDRLRIETMLKDGRKVKDIANEIGVHISTIYNEIKRGRYMHTNYDLTEEERYSPDIAHQAYRENLAAKGPDLKIGNDHALAQFIEDKIADEDYSPGAVLGHIIDEGLSFNTTICETTLYSYIDKGIFGRITNKNLPEKGKRKRQYNKVKQKAAKAPRGESIENRPEEVNDRETFGHWEMDCVEGKKKTKKTLLVLTERLTRNEIVILMPDKTMASVIAALNRLERHYGARFYKIFKTITVDNGSEFSDCAGMERSCLRKKARTKVYYCHPYSSYERGSNENINKMVRRRFPKGTDFTNIKNQAVKAAEAWINNYPREIHGWRSAGSLFAEHVACIT